MRAKKSFGQHFLHDQKVIKKMIDAVPFGQASVVEVGPGTGAITEGIAPRQGTRPLILVEADRDLVAHLRDAFPQATLVNADAAKVDFASLVSAPWILVGNLPYNAAAAIVMNALTSHVPPERLFVLVQREQADRMLAAPGDMSTLSVAVQLYTKPRKVFNVKPGAFTPAPKVDSSYVELVVRRNVNHAENEAVIGLAKAGFASRRKQLQKNLVAAGRADAHRIKTVLETLGHQKTVRAQELSVDDWKALYSALQ